MTKQEYFNLLVETSRNGGFPAIVNGACRYRCEDGRKCAVGLLIDDIYDKNMEGKLFKQLYEDFPETREFLPDWMNVYDMDRVQAYHDNMARNGWDHNYFVRLLKERVFADCQEELTFNVTLGEP